MKSFRFSALVLTSFAALNSPLSVSAQQPTTTAEQARKRLDEAHAKAAEPAKAETTPAPKPAGPLNFNNIPVPPPKVIQPKLSVKSKPSAPPTTIDALKLVYSQDKSMATFTGKVRLRSLSTDIDCEEMVLYFKKPEDKKAAEPAPPVEPGKTAAESPIGDGEEGGMEIEKAVAKGLGSIVTIVKRSPKDTSVCKCGEATYVEKTGIMVMKIWPEVFQGGKGLRANDRDTVMTLDKNNTLSANGALRSVIPQEEKKDKNDADKTPGATTPGAAPKPPAAPAPIAPTASSGTPKSAAR